MLYYIIISRQNQRKLPPARLIPVLHRIPVSERKSAKKKAIYGNKEYNKREKQSCKKGVILMDTADQVVEYLWQCGVFFLATARGMQPRVRPMDGVCEYKGNLCFPVLKDSELYQDLLMNRRAEISAMHPDKTWISVRGELEETSDPDALSAMLRTCRDNIDNMHRFRDAAPAIFLLKNGTVRLFSSTGSCRESSL